MYRINTPYVLALDIRRDDDRLDHVSELPPAGVVWLLLAPRRGRKTWTLRGLENRFNKSRNALYIDLSTDTNNRFHQHFERGSIVLLDEPLTNLDPRSRASNFLQRCAELYALGVRVVLALTPREYQLLLAVDKKKLVSIDALLNIPPLSRQEADTLAGTDTEAKQLVATAGADWYRSAYRLVLLFETNVSHRATDGSPLSHRDLLRTVIQSCEMGNVKYFENVVKRGLSEQQQETLLDVVTHGVTSVSPTITETLELAHLIEKHPDEGGYRIADPILAWHLAPLRIHHISDIHVGPKSAESIDAKEAGLLADAMDRGAVREGYLSHVRKLKNAGRAPHLLVISGDVVEWATEAQYREARRFLDELHPYLDAHPLLDAADPRLLLVGGNHDVDWSQTRGGPIQMRHQRFAHAFSGYPHPHLEEPPERRCLRVVSYPDLGLEILLLGSSEFGGEIEEDRERWQLQKEMAKLPRDPSKQDRAKAEELATQAARIDPGLVHSRDLDRVGEHRFRQPIRIAVLHHPLSPLPSTEVTRWAGLLNAGAVKQTLFGAGISLVLHGHVHAGFFAEERWPGRHDGRALRIAAAPSLGSREIAENNGFNEIEIRRDRDGDGRQSHRIVVRRWVREGERSWRAVEDEMGPFEPAGSGR